MCILLTCFYFEERRLLRVHYSQVILEFGHTSTLRDAVDSNVPGAATHDWEVRLEGLKKALGWNIAELDTVNAVDTINAVDLIGAVDALGDYHWTSLKQRALLLSRIFKFSWNISKLGATFSWRVSFGNSRSLS